jgi:AraC-like DNA-binding protein
MPLVIEAALSCTFSADAWPAEGLRFIRLARERWRRGTVSPGRRPPWWTLGLVGKGCLHLQRLGRDLRAGALFLSPPEAFRRMAVQGGSAEVYFAALQQPPSELWPNTLADTGILQVADPRLVTERFAQLITEGRPGDHLAHQACIHRLHLLLLAACRNAVTDNEDRRALAHFRTAQQLLDEGWDRIDSVETVARHCGVSHTYLCRLFRRYADCTPLQYWTRRRIRAAAELLWRSEASLADIAAAIGFADQFAFSKAFKRLQGVSPSTWQAHMRREGSHRNCGQ